LLNASQALDFRKPSLPGEGVKRGMDFIRDKLGIPFIQNDMPMALFIAKISKNIEDFVNHVEKTVPLKI